MMIISFAWRKWNGIFLHGAHLFPSLVQQNLSLFVILSADLWDKQVFCRKGIHLSALPGFLCSIDGSSTESQRSRNIMKLAHHDRTQQRWDWAHCYFFSSLCFCMMVLVQASSQALPISVYLLQYTRSCSAVWVPKGHLGTHFVIPPNLPTQPSSFQQTLLSSLNR